MRRIKRSGTSRCGCQGRNSSTSGLVRFLLFLSGAFAAALTVRASAKLAKRSVGPAPPREIPRTVSASGSALPQTEKWSDVRAHERSDVNLPVLGIVLVILVIGAFVIHASLWWWVNAAGTARLDTNSWQAIARRGAEPLKGFPKLQVSPQRDLQEFLADQQQRLRGSRISTATGGLARIPIDRAMEIIAERGTPKWNTGEPSQKRMSPLELQRQRANSGAK